MTVQMRQEVEFTYIITFAPYTDARTTLQITCIQSGDVFCQILSAKVVSVGKNIDGFLDEYNFGFMPFVYSRQNVPDNFYVDTVTFDLGVITNTCKLFIGLNHY
jgi:hypothetical protein